MTYSATSGFFLLAASFSGFFITFRFFDIAGLRSVLASHSVRPGRASLPADVHEVEVSGGLSTLADPRVSKQCLRTLLVGGSSLTGQGLSGARQAAMHT